MTGSSATPCGLWEAGDVRSVSLLTAGSPQNYFFAFTPNSPFGPLDVALQFSCDGVDPATSTVGLNTLLLVADANPVPDIIALAATPTADGIVNVEGGSGVFSVSNANVGIASDITVVVDTGNATLPINVAVCETDIQQAGACVNPPAPTFDPVTTTVGAGATPTFSFFISSTGSVPFDPANNRIFVRYQDSGGVTRGSTSVAVRTLD